jgi:hypothetical protein
VEIVLIVGRIPGNLVSIGDSGLWGISIVAGVGFRVLYRVVTRVATRVDSRVASIVAWE